MRKRPSRPKRFVSLDNGAIDTIRSMTAKGLLATLIRAKDGDEVTVDGLCRTHTEGREVLSKAMRALVSDAFVVKFKIQRASSQIVELEDGTTETKRGGSWWTTFTVDSIPFTGADVAAMLADIYEAGNVKAVRVEPERFDPRNDPANPPRPTYGFPSVGPTCGNSAEGGPAEAGKPEESRGRPTDGFPTVGRPTVGRSAAHIRKKTSYAHAGDETGDAISSRSDGDARRASEGSSAREDESGSAASGKESSPHPQQKKPPRADRGHKSSSKRTVRHTAAELKTVRAVRAFYPPELLKDLPELPTVSESILSAMRTDGRTVEQLGDRILYRWVNHGYAVKFHAGVLQNPVGAAIGLVRPLRRGDRYACPDARCENGRDIETGEECRLCKVRIADWKAAQSREWGQGRPGSTEGSSDAVMPRQRTAQPRSGPLMKDCAEPICPRSILSTGGPLCGDCQADALAAEQAARETLAGWDAEADISAEAPADQPDEEAAETARIRAQLAAQFGTPDQIEAYTRVAPF